MENYDQVFRAHRPFHPQMGPHRPLRIAQRALAGARGRHPHRLQHLRHQARFREKPEAQVAHARLLPQERRRDHSAAQMLRPRRRADLHPPRRLSGGGQARHRLRRQQHLQDLQRAAELDAFFRDKPDGVTFVMEQFIDGLVVTYDGLVNRDGEVVFAASTRYDQSVMDVVNQRPPHELCLPPRRSIRRSRRPGARS